MANSVDPYQTAPLGVLSHLYVSILKIFIQSSCASGKGFIGLFFNQDPFA